MYIDDALLQVLHLIVHVLHYFAATSSVDYTSVTPFSTLGRLRFNSFTSRQCSYIRTRYDAIVEGTEDFLVQLQTSNSLPSSVELARTNATIFITDNDGMLCGIDSKYGF